MVRKWRRYQSCSKFPVPPPVPRHPDELATPALFIRDRAVLACSICALLKYNS